MKTNKKNKQKFTLAHFFFGYTSGSNARFGYLVKRIIWCLVVLSAIRYWISLLWGMLVQKDLSCLPLIFPVFIFTSVAILFCNFD